MWACIFPIFHDVVLLDYNNCKAVSPVGMRIFWPVKTQYSQKKTDIFSLKRNAYLSQNQSHKDFCKEKITYLHMSLRRL